LYGSSALNGVINFRTADAGKVPENRFFAEAGLYDRPANKNWVWWNSPRVFSNYSFSHLKSYGSNDIGVAINISDNNSYRKYNDELLGRLSFKLKHHNEKITGMAYGLNVNSGYTKKTDFILWEDAEYGALKQDTSTVSTLGGSFLAIDPFFSYDRKGPAKHEWKMRLQSANNRFAVRDENDSEAFSVYSEYQLNYRFSDVINTTAGFAGNYNVISSKLYGDHKGKNFAGFMQAETTPLRKLKFVAGIRLEYNSLDGINDRIVPIFRTGINWQVADYTFLRASFGQGYRYPSVAEKYAATTLGSIRIIPNPDVKPESGWSSEAGVKQGLLIGDFEGQADISIFLSQNSDLIEFELITNPYTGFRARNVEQSRILGYEMEFLLRKDKGNHKTTLSGGYTYLNPIEPLTGDFLKYRRKHSFKLSASNSYNRFEAGLSVFFRSKILNIDNVFLNEMTREIILPGFYSYWTENNKGYFLADCHAGYRILKNITLSLAVKNLTNTEYMGRPGDIQPHRNFTVRISGDL
jgi:outer membrane receptor protein involved in Fe transport